MLVGVCCVRGCCLDSSRLDVLCNIYMLDYLCEKMLYAQAAPIWFFPRKISGSVLIILLSKSLPNLDIHPDM